jgi:hypothetical protein
MLLPFNIGVVYAEPLSRGFLALSTCFFIYGTSIMGIGMCGNALPMQWPASGCSDTNETLFFSLYIMNNRF